jgi:hypothetical protein
VVGSSAALRVGHIEVEPPVAVDRPFPNLGPGCRAATIPNCRSPSGKRGSTHRSLGLLVACYPVLRMDSPKHSPWLAPQHEDSSQAAGRSLEAILTTLGGRSMHDPASELLRISLLRTQVNKDERKGRSPGMEPRPSVRAPYGNPALLDRELPALVLITLYVGVLVERVARQVLLPTRHRGLVGPSRSEVASRVEDRLLGCSVVADGGRNPGGGAVGVELDQLKGRGCNRVCIPVGIARVHILREGGGHVGGGGYRGQAGATDPRRSGSPHGSSP